MTNTMDKYCLFGNPVEHSKSPRIHMRFAELTGQRLVYDKVCAPVDGFANAVADFRAAGGRGCNITVPFKLQVAALATVVTQRAQLAGACNVLKFDGDTVLADNSDGQGLVRDITLNAGFDIQGRDVLLIGGGGAAAGVLGPLVACKPRRVLVANRTLSKAEHIVQIHADFSAQHQVAVTACDL
ncbi:MAG: shikimate dehydrogenase, partial [Burkholderiaceae bacterium]|nr:shikimate dehydrogenase [Burkholderiaceae bacterium]